MTKRLGKTRERKGKQKEEKRVVDRLEREGGWERKMRQDDEKVTGERRNEERRGCRIRRVLVRRAKVNRGRG